MKKSLLSILAVICLLTVVTSCKKKSNNNSSSTNSMSATVGSTNFSVSSNTSVVAAINSGILSVSGVNGSMQSISLNIDSFSNATGTFPLGGGSLNSGLWESAPGSGTNAAYGSVNITAVSPNITGTFSFTCADSTKVTNGSFSVKHP